MVKVTCEEPEKWKKEQEDSFDVDAFLNSIPTHPEYHPHCPRCLLDLTRGVIKRQDGTDWIYYGCPMIRFDTKCYITCGEDELQDYLRAVQKQTHPCYRTIPPENFLCECKQSMILAMSKSEKNPGRLYLKCPKRQCKLFQWIDTIPSFRTHQILGAGH